MNIGLGHREVTRGTRNGIPSLNLFARVVDIILDPSHPQYQEKGGSQALNGVFYSELNRTVDEKDVYTLNFAYCSNTGLKHTPLKNEIIQVEALPSEYREDMPTAVKYYWTRLIPLWNSANHNAYPDLFQIKNQDKKLDLGLDFIENPKILPLQSFSGDVIIEGRSGNSIRLGGSQHNLNTLSDSTNNGDPFLVIRNGSINKESTPDTTVEDINTDKTSIYLTSSHKVLLKQPIAFGTSWRKIPLYTNSYKGAQAVINSDRIVLNAKDDNILLFSKEGVGLIGNSVNIEGQSYVGLDSKKVYIGGTLARQESEPMLLGGTTSEWLESLLDKLDRLLKSLAEMGTDPVIALPVLIADATAIAKTLPILKNELKNIKSTKTFVE